MDEGHDVEFLLDCKVVADFLIAAITLVHRIEKDMEREREFTLTLDRLAAFKCFVLRRVVDDQHFDVIVGAERFGNARQHALNGFLRVIGDDENQEFWLLGLRSTNGFSRFLHKFPQSKMVLRARQYSYRRFVASIGIRFGAILRD